MCVLQRCVQASTQRSTAAVHLRTVVAQHGGADGAANGVVIDGTDIAFESLD